MYVLKCIIWWLYITNWLISSWPLSLNYLNKTHLTTYHILYFCRLLCKFIRMYLVLNYIFQYRLVVVVTIYYNNIQIVIRAVVYAIKCWINCVVAHYWARHSYMYYITIYHLLRDIIAIRIFVRACGEFSSLYYIYIFRRAVSRTKENEICIRGFPILNEPLRIPRRYILFMRMAIYTPDLYTHYYSVAAHPCVRDV